MFTNLLCDSHFTQPEKIEIAVSNISVNIWHLLIVLSSYINTCEIIVISLSFFLHNYVNNMEVDNKHKDWIEDINTIEAAFKKLGSPTKEMLNKLLKMMLVKGQTHDLSLILQSTPKGMLVLHIKIWPQWHTKSKNWQCNWLPSMMAIILEIFYIQKYCKEMLLTPKISILCKMLKAILSMMVKPINTIINRWNC